MDECPALEEIRYGKELGLRHSYKYIYVSCKVCGEFRWAPYFSGVIPIYCKKCFPACLKWRGGIIERKGYIRILLKNNDLYFPMANGAGYVLEHRLIIARHLGRCLKSWEVVHHKNGIKTDNRLENLELLPGVKEHLVDTAVKRTIASLEKRVTILEAENILLKEQVKEMQEECPQMRSTDGKNNSKERLSRSEVQILWS